MALSTCRECGHQVSNEAPTCPACGVPNPSSVAPPFGAQRLAAQQPVVYIQREGPSNGIAAVLSFLIPGMGQLYKGKIVSGLLWFFAAIIGYVLLIVPGLLIHLFCIINAATTDPA